MNMFSRSVVIVGIFTLIAGAGVLLSLSAPYSQDGDELTYLAGTLEERTGDLPDAYMLTGYEYSPYLYPYIMSRWYESLGHNAFKSIYLALLILSTGLSAYFTFRLLWLPWIPALALSVVMLLPRFASGMEVFGVLTFNEAQGRAAAVPLFFIATAYIIRRMVDQKSLWPVFGAIGLFAFLHPVTVMLFASIALLAVTSTELLRRVPVWKVLRDVALSGVAFVLGGSYFFIEVFERLARGLISDNSSSALYVSAVVDRVAWEFPAASVLWFRHMAIVSALFLALLVMFYTVPALRALRARYPLPHSREVVTWGITVAGGALLLCLVLPGLNLYLMEHANAPYLFQQWSRISKFYYLGLFVALTPVVYALSSWYRESTYRFKTVVVALLVTAALASSSFGFETAQFFVGYPNFKTAYIPQALSGVPDDITPEEYRETCRSLARLSATSDTLSDTLVISDDFALRYYCRTKLYVTREEGAAYLQLLRADLVLWHDRELAQEKALGSADPVIFAFAKRVGADFIVVPRVSKYESLEALQSVEVGTTTRHIIVRVSGT